MKNVFIIYLLIYSLVWFIWLKVISLYNANYMIIWFTLIYFNNALLRSTCLVNRVTHYTKLVKAVYNKRSTSFE